MQRRNFLKAGIVAGGALALPGLESGEARAATTYHMRYAPRLDFLDKELTIPQRLEVFAKHGFDATEYNGLMNHPLRA